MAELVTTASSREQLDIWHVAYPVADLDRSIAFYCGGLGLRLVSRDDETAFVSLGQRGFTIEFMIEPRAEAASTHRAPDHIAFEAHDLETYREKLVAAGLSASEIQVIGDGMKRFALDDPDGVRLDFFQGRDGLEAFIAGDS
jgi:catechol 2,3-dioxygenase-like lactoylglutathione lyase family enzyme